MHTNEWSFTDGYCKIKTARQKKRLQKEDFEKHLIKLNSLQEQLRIQKQNLPLIPLEQPYQRGWMRAFALREDIARSRAGAFYQTLLPKINTVEYSPDKTFKRKRRKQRRKIYELRPQYLREFYAHEWNDPKCKLTNDEKAHFHWKECWSKDGKTMTLKLAFNEPWRFVLSVRPYMVTHVKMVDEILEQQMQQLSNYILQNYLGPKMRRLTYGYSYNRRHIERNEKQENPLKNKSLHNILESVANDDL